MTKTRGTGLLMLWTDVDPQHEAEFNRWYDEEHLNRLLKVPGFLSAARYEALRGGRSAPPPSSTRCAFAPPRAASRPPAGTWAAITC